MRRIRLETGEGEYVATASIPPFPDLPEVVLWGARVFHLHQPDPVTYREAFFVVAFDVEFEDGSE
jgi:hypothetical protein